MVLDRQQIAFILCVNDEEEYAECRYYLDRLHIPEGYQVDIIEIREASSMAAGYNAGMKSSAAKYKVYLHQDVFIRNTEFISDMLKVFACDEQIGMLGMVGNTGKISLDIEWNVGKVMENRGQWKCESPSREDVFVEVQAADGLLLATQYDILWREDLFDGWDLYDISQCMEFRRAGYKVAVPWQENAWCYHDNAVPNLTAYYDYYRIFVCEYGSMADFSAEKSDGDYSIEKEQAHQTAMMSKAMEELFMVCGRKDRAQLREIFQSESVRGWACLEEYEAIIRIDWLEERNRSRLCFWEEGMSVVQLLSKLRILRRALKRIEYVADFEEKEWILDNYSKYAVEDICERYVIDKARVYSKLSMNQ